MARKPECGFHTRKQGMTQHVDCARMHNLPFGRVQQSVCGCVQITQREFQLTEDFTAPKGALLMPSLIASSMQVSLHGPCPHATHRTSLQVYLV